MSKIFEYFEVSTFIQNTILSIYMDENYTRRINLTLVICVTYRLCGEWIFHAKTITYLVKECKKGFQSQRDFSTIPWLFVLQAPQSFQYPSL
jgi:hypothetical protein